MNPLCEPGLPRTKGHRITSAASQRSVVVAVVAVRMMKPVTDQIVDVVAVRHSLVSATGAVAMAGLVTRRRACVLRRMLIVDG